MSMSMSHSHSHSHSRSSPERMKSGTGTTTTTTTLSPTKFFRKSRERMIAVSSPYGTPGSGSAPSRRPTRLRRLPSKAMPGTATASTKAATSTAKSSSSTVLEARGKEGKGKMLPPPLTPIQIMIRRLYDKINRSHKAALNESKKQLWKENRDSVSELMREHHRAQLAHATSSLLLSSPSDDLSLLLLTADQIYDATMKAAINKATTAPRIKVLVVPETADKLGAMGLEQDGREYQRIPVTTIGHVSQIPPVLDWTAIPNNMHEDDGKFLTNIPFLGDEFIDKDAKFIDEMVTLYEGKVHEAKDSTNFRKMDDDVLHTLVQAMVKIEADEGPAVFLEGGLVPPSDQQQEKESEKEKDVEMEVGLEEESPTSTSTSAESTPAPPSPKKTFPELAAMLFTPAEEAERNAECSSRKPSLSTTPPPVLSPQNVLPDIDLEEIIKEEPETVETETEEKAVLPQQAEQEEKEEQDLLPPPGEKMELESELKVEESSFNLCQMDKVLIDPSPVPVQVEVNDSSNESANSGSKPSDQIFSLLSTTFKGLGSPGEIRERYDNVEKMREISSLPILSNGMEEQPPESYSIPNIEGPFAKYLPKEATMHAYRILFCRRCFTYDCKRHSKHPIIRRSYKCPKSLTDLELSTCWQMNDVLPRSPDDILSEWGPGDRSLFSCFVESFPNNYCFIAYLMRNKSCAQVKEYADLANLPKSESSSKGVASRRAKHRKQRQGYNKKSSGNSSSKRNITRRWINNVKKTEKLKEDGGIKSPGGKLPPRYMPCLHEDGGECDANCRCRINKTSCEKFCTCALNCPYRFPGCKCLSTCDSKRCICFAAARECDPDLCLGCGANEVQLEKISCHNVNIQRKLHKHLLMGRSDISGWGIYIKDDAQKGEFIAEYRGELISYDESERRGHVYDKIQHTFLFELNDHFVVDATRKGNKARFANSSKNPNCEVKRMLVNGDHRIGIYAKRFIEAGEELFYDYEDVLEKQQARKNLQE